MPTTVRVPIHTPTYTNLASTENVDSLWKASNAIFLESGILSRRPAFYAQSSFIPLGPCRSLMQVNRSVTAGTYTGLPVIGFQYQAPNYCKVFRMIRTNSYEFSQASTTETIYAGDASSVGPLPNIAYDKQRFYVARTNTGKIGYFTHSAALANMADADAPTDCQKIQFASNYILAQKGDYIYRSAAGDGLVWELKKFSPSGDPDDLVTFHVFDGLIYLFGRSSIEIWAHDTVTPFSRVSNGIIDEGIAHQKAVTVAAGALYFMSAKGQLMRIRGLNAERVPGATQERFAMSEGFWDCALSTLHYRGREYVAVSLNNKVTVYDPSGELSYFWNIGALSDTATGEAIPDYGLAIDSSVFSPAVELGTGINLVSVTYPFDAVCHLLDSDSFQVDYNGQVLYPSTFDVRTGHISYGTDKLKRSNEFRLYLSRPTTTALGVNLSITFVDDVVHSQGPYTIDVRFGGENEAIVRLPRTGVYRTRQYKLVSTDAVPIRIMKAEEDIEVLRS